VLDAPIAVEVSTGRSARWLASAPELVTCALAGFSLPTMLLLLAGHLVWLIAFPVGIACAAGAVWFAGTTTEPVGRDVVRWTAIVLGLLLIWTIVNAFFSAQDVYAHRDPATYNLAGRYLVDHSTLRMNTQAQIFGNPTGFTDESAGFEDFRTASPGLLAAQGNHLLPILLAAAGRLAGSAGVLKANVGFGALSLFAFFGLARRIVGPRYGALVTAGLAVSLPMIYVSRDTFSETLALLFLMGALTLLHRAVSGGRFADYALCGFVAGTSAMVRIDSYASLLALIVAAAVILAHAPPDSRKTTSAKVAALIAVGLVPTILGWVDVSRLSPAYYADQRHAIVQLAEAGVALTVLSVAAVALIWKRGLGTWIGGNRRRLTIAGSVLVVAAFAFFASRPLWYVSHGVFTPYLLQVQKDSHVALDGTRTYNEQTVDWQVIYFGPITVLLAVGGYVVLLRRFLLRRDWSIVGALTMGLMISALYLYASQITPDQIWASRRYIPVVMPMLLVAAAAALRAMPWRRVAIAGAVLLVAFPLAVTIPAFTIREGYPHLSQLSQICDDLPKNAAVVTVDYNASWSYQMAVRAYCDVPTISVQQASVDALAAMQSAVRQHGRTLYALSTDPTKLSSPSKLMPLSTITAQMWPSTLQTSPRRPAHETVSVYLGLVQSDGAVIAVG
jgi:Dolichyl-phosphate-mannose-protein mannosyltransferase